MSLSIPAISTETIYTDVTSDVDPTALPVSFAFMTSGDPSTGDWKTGSWDGTAEAITGGRYRARAEIRIGPGSSVTLTAGTYGGWVRVVDDTPDGPTRRFDTIVIT